MFVSSYRTNPDNKDADHQPDGSGHAVLTVRTHIGDYILDNMHDQVLLWSDTQYTFLKRQSSRHSGRWTRIKQSSPTTVGSVLGN